MNKIKALALLRKIAVHKHTIPSLGSIHLNGAGATATDLETNVHISNDVLGLNVTGEGCVPLAYFEKAVKAGAEIVHIGQKPGSSELQMEWSRGKVVCLPVDDFPMIPRVDDTVELPGAFMEAYNVVKVATTTDDARYALNGIRLEATGKVVASDWHRLHIADSGFRSDWLEKGITIPMSIMSLLPADVVRVGFAPEADGVTGRRITFYGPGYNIGGRELMGTFPNWEKVIPRDTPANMEYEADPLADALERLRSFSATPKKAPITVKLQDGALRLTLSNQEGEETWETVPIQANGDGGQDIRVSLNAFYLEQAIRAVGDGRIGIKNEMSAIHIVGQHGTAVVMPMRV